MHEKSGKERRRCYSCTPGGIYPPFRRVPSPNVNWSAEISGICQEILKKNLLLFYFFRIASGFFSSVVGYPHGPKRRSAVPPITAALAISSCSIQDDTRWIIPPYRSGSCSKTNGKSVPKRRRSAPNVSSSG